MSAMSGVTPQRLTLTVTVDVDPVAHGFDLLAEEAEQVIRSAIDARPGLQVIESDNTCFTSITE